MQERTPAVDLHVRVADAQGLRLLPGGEIRLVITLRAADDPEGEAFGAKVTPWLQVPEDQAPQWRARGAIFSVPVGRCCQAAFQDSAHLHIVLMQRGHSLRSERAAAQPSTRGLGWSALKPKGLNAALQSASSSLPLTWPLGGGSSTAARGDAIGALGLPVGQRLACPDGALAEECSEWLQLVEEQQQQRPGEGEEAGAGRRIKGCLLLEVAAVPTQPPAGAEPLVVPASAACVPASPDVPVAHTGGDLPPADVARGADATAARGEDSAEFAPQAEELSETASESGAASDTASVGGAASACSTAQTADIDDERGATAPAPPDLLSPSALAELLASAGTRGGDEPRSLQWLPFGKVVQGSSPADGFDSDASWNIFAINDPSSGSQAMQPGRLQWLLQKWSHPRKQMRPLKQRVRSTLDPKMRRRRTEARRWRQWHEVFCVLNDVERHLGEALGLLAQAAASMRRFGESHATLQDVPRLSAFLGDAALYFRSEAEVPERVEALLGDLERSADEFRSISIEPASTVGPSSAAGQPFADVPAEAGSGQSELYAACEDLQVDIAVLLESALMAAQQALADYKKMHCRLELLATEYEPICRLELEAQSPVLLPLLTDRSEQVAAASLPEQAVQWALDFSQLVGASSKGLHRLVRELEHRRCQLKACSDEFRALMLRCAACGGQPRESTGPGG